MAEEYKIRPYLPGDEEGIVELLELVFNSWPKFDLNYTPLHHWRWKYQDNPIKKIIISLGVGNDKIIGCDHTIISRVKIGDRIFLLGTGVDLAVHPDFRELGIWRRMDELLKELRPENDVNISLSISSNLRVINSLTKFFPRIPFDLLHFVRINDIDLHLKMSPTEHAWFVKYGFQIVKILNKIANRLKVSYSSDQIFNISEISRLDKRINIFWNQIKDHYLFIFERTQDYLNWRYCDPRGGNYIIKIAEEGEQILGYSIVRINRYQKDYPIGYIVDLITLQERLDVADALVADAIHLFDRNKINIIQCQLIKKHPYERILKKHGFINSRRRINIFYKNYSTIDELNKLKKISPKMIHFVYGDYDCI